MHPLSSLRNLNQSILLRWESDPGPLAQDQKAWNYQQVLLKE